MAFVLFAQFFLNGLHLLAQIVLALRLLDPILHFALDLVPQLLDFQLLRQVLVDLLQPHMNVESLERVLLVGRGKRWQGRSNEVHQPAGLVDIHGHRGEFVRKSRRTGHDLLEQG